MSMPLSRRSLLLGAAAGLLLPHAAFASLPGDRRLVVIILRGGMDGLHAVPPVGDPAYAGIRGGLALGAGALPLDGTFALHPALGPLMPLWSSKELAVVHACASPYRQRSHFDAQDILESGGTIAHALRDGWLNRALVVLGGGRGSAMAIAQGLPLLLRGNAPAASWAPSPLPGLPPEQVAALRALYAGDELMSTAFEEGAQMEAFAAEIMAEDMGGSPDRKKSSAFPGLAGAAGKLMAAADGPRLAVMELGGWDTHTSQMNRMVQPLAQLAGGITALAEALGAHWRQTVVLAMSEFGRTVAINGTGGSDHGTGGALLLAGGAIQGGKVFTDWPGLGSGNLHQGRDLKPTTDCRAVFKALLGDHLGLPGTALDSTIFPDSAAVRPLAGMVRL
jgi:uncharacterized protein (DUF1501 family)